MQANKDEKVQKNEEKKRLKGNIVNRNFQKIYEVFLQIGLGNDFKLFGTVCTPVITCSW